MTVEGLVELKEEEKGNVLVFKIHGRLDAISSPSVEKRILEFIDQGHYKLLLNFSGVDYLSSAGMRMLLSILKKLKSYTGKLVVCSITPNVMDVLKMSGFDHVLELTQTEEDAMNRF